MVRGFSLPVHSQQPFLGGLALELFTEFHVMCDETNGTSLRALRTE